MAIPAIALALTAAATTNQVMESNQAERVAGREVKKQERVQLAMQDELSRKQAQQDAVAQRAAQSAESRQRALAAGYNGTSSTIRTNPLGLSGGGGGQKTLLGGV